MKRRAFRCEQDQFGGRIKSGLAAAGTRGSKAGREPGQGPKPRHMCLDEFEESGFKSTVCVIGD